MLLILYKYIIDDIQRGLCLYDKFDLSKVPFVCRLYFNVTPFLKIDSSL